MALSDGKYVEKRRLYDIVYKSLVDLVQFQVQLALFERVAARDNEHIAADGVKESHLEGGGTDGLDGAIFGEVYLVLAIILDVRMDDLCLHGVKVVEIGAECKQLVDVEL